MKLKLNLDELTVDSFDTSAKENKRGTVVGQQCTCWTYCAQQTCPGCPTCDATCAYTCDDATCPQCPTCAQSCNGSCDCATYDYTCQGCTAYDVTCRGIGTCGRYPCADIP
jgi:hypothetical protein